MMTIDETTHVTRIIGNIIDCCCFTRERFLRTKLIDDLFMLKIKEFHILKYFYDHHMTKALSHTWFYTKDANLNLLKKSNDLTNMKP